MLLLCAGFLRKVYGILTAQLLLTVAVSVLCLFVPQVKGFVQTRCACVCVYARVCVRVSE